MIPGWIRFAGFPMTVAWAGLAGALVLSLSLAIGLCTDMCVGTHKWTIFGFPFPLFGIGFFGITLVLFHLRERPAVRDVFPAVIAGAWGAELTFLYVQHSIIRQWCPICVAVAFCVLLAGAALAPGYFSGIRQRFGTGRGAVMRYLSKGAVLAAMMVAGAYVAFLGLGNPASSHAETIPLALGKLDADVEVYVITDWFCAACRKAEPDMERAYPNIMSRARLVFVDLPIHRESMNFIPYNLSFLVREKEKYLAIRKALLELATRTREPTPEDVQKAVAHLGVTYRPLNYADVNAGIQYFQHVVKSFQVAGTPAMVVYNRKTKDAKVLNGIRDLSYPVIMMAVSGVGPG